MRENHRRKGRRSKRSAQAQALKPPSPLTQMSNGYVGDRLFCNLFKDPFVFLLEFAGRSFDRSVGRGLAGLAKASLYSKEKFGTFVGACHYKAIHCASRLVGTRNRLQKEGARGAQIIGRLERAGGLFLFGPFSPLGCWWGVLCAWQAADNLRVAANYTFGGSKRFGW